jgi:pilus assembly protein TadC
VIALVLACAWAALAALAVLAIADRRAVIARARSQSRRGRHPHRSRRLRTPAVPARVLRVFGAPVRIRRARGAVAVQRAELPVCVDLVAVAMGSGCTPFQAVELGVRWSPPAIASVLAGVGRATALGSSFDEALRSAGASAPIVRPLTDVLRTSARLGAPASDALARLAREVRADVRRRAEARARTIPVRLLFPLVFCVLPAFALLTVVPMLLDGIRFA